MTVWTENEAHERYDQLFKNRQRLVDGFVRLFLAETHARRRLHRVSRKLTEDEERIGTALALDVLLERRRST